VTLKERLFDEKVKNLSSGHGEDPGLFASILHGSRKSRKVGSAESCLWGVENEWKRES